VGQRLLPEDVGLPSAVLGKALDRATLAEICGIIATAIRLCVPEPGQHAPPLDIAIIVRARTSLKHMIATAETLADDMAEEQEQPHSGLGPLDDDIPFKSERPHTPLPANVISSFKRRPKGVQKSASRGQDNGKSVRGRPGIRGSAGTR
jgi:hypothetical protein